MTNPCSPDQTRLIIRALFNDSARRGKGIAGARFDRSSPPEIVISRPNVIDGINQDALEMQKESYMDDFELMIQKYMAKIKKAQ